MTSRHLHRFDHRPVGRRHHTVYDRSQCHDGRQNGNHHKFIRFSRLHPSRTRGYRTSGRTATRGTTTPINTAIPAYRRLFPAFPRRSSPGGTGRGSIRRVSRSTRRYGRGRSRLCRSGRLSRHSRPDTLTGFSPVTSLFLRTLRIRWRRRLYRSLLDGTVHSSGCRRRRISRTVHARRCCRRRAPRTSRSGSRHRPLGGSRTDRSG